MYSAVAVLALATVFYSFKKSDKKVNFMKAELELVATNINLETSVLNWKGSKPLGTHNGNVKFLEGSLEVKNGKVKGGEFVIDMTSINTLDLKAGSGKEKLDGHLMSADFFDVEKYPTSKFVITKVKGANVTGNLTIKDVTKTITFPAKVAVADGKITFSSDVIKINRADFNVKYGSKSFFDNLKDKFIDDIMEISFEIHAQE